VILKPKTTAKGPQHCPPHAADSDLPFAPPFTPAGARLLTVPLPNRLV
jgi:hypothetical protein